MSTLNLKEKYPELLQEMVALGYSKHYIEIIRSNIFKLLELNPSPNQDDYVQYEKFLREQHPDKGILSYLSILNKIKRFHFEGIIPKPRQRHAKAHAYQKLNYDYRTILEAYKEVALQDGHCFNSIQCITMHGADFLYFLQEQNINRISDVTEPAIRGFFMQGKNGHRGYCTKQHIESIFKKLSSGIYAEYCRKILTFLPKIPKSKKNYEFLTKGEATKVKSILSETSSLLSNRDKAIGCLAFYTGIRSGDIVNLQFQHINWNKNEIRFNQQKTGNEIILPLTATVGNAIYDYVTIERSKSDLSFVFLSDGKWVTKMTQGMLYLASKKIFSAAGIRQSDERKGLHLFRHNFVTTLLEKEVDSAIISKCLGHQSPDSINHYLDSDLVHLKECSLSIDQYPVRKEVFAL